MVNFDLIVFLTTEIITIFKIKKPEKNEKLNFSISNDD